MNLLPLRNTDLALVFLGRETSKPQPQLLPSPLVSEQKRKQRTRVYLEFVPMGAKFGGR